MKIGEDVDNIGDFSLFSQSVNSYAVKASIIGLSGNEQSTNTAASLEKVFEIFRTEGRDNKKYPYIVLVATDGKSGNTFQTKRFSSILKLNGMNIIINSIFLLPCLFRRKSQAIGMAILLLLFLLCKNLMKPITQKVLKVSTPIFKYLLFVTRCSSKTRSITLKANFSVMSLFNQKF